MSWEPRRRRRQARAVTPAIFQASTTPPTASAGRGGWLRLHPRRLLAARWAGTLLAGVGCEALGQGDHVGHLVHCLLCLRAPRLRSNDGPLAQPRLRPAPCAFASATGRAYPPLCSASRPPAGLGPNRRTGRYACPTSTDKERRHVSVRAMTGRCGHTRHLARLSDTRPMCHQALSRLWRLRPLALRFWTMASLWRPAGSI